VSANDKVTAQALQKLREMSWWGGKVVCWSTKAAAVHINTSSVWVRFALIQAVSVQVTYWRNPYQ